MVTVADLIRYRLQNERYIHRVAESVMPTAHGDFRMIAYESEVEGGESHVALVYGDVTDGIKTMGASYSEGAYALPGGRCVWDDAMRLSGSGGGVFADDCGCWAGGAGLSA